MLNKMLPFEVHVIRADGTSYTASGHHTARRALQALRRLENMPQDNPKYTPRSRKVWCSCDSKSYDLDTFKVALANGYYSEI